MNKFFLSACLILGTIACHSATDGKRGAINLGRQPTAITLTATANDLALSVSHAAVGTIIRLTPASGGSTITGIDSTLVEDGDIFVLRNESTTDTVSLTNADTSSTTAADRFMTPNAATVVLDPKNSTWIEWDKTSAAWLVGPGSTGAFSSAVTFSGAITKGVETKTSGTLSATKVSYLSVTSAVAFTLPDGTTAGQIKEIECSVAATSPAGTLTITTPDTVASEPATHVFTAVGQRLVLQWRTTGWHVIGKTRVGTQAVVVGTTVLTGYDMCATYALSVTATVHSLTTMGIPAPLVGGEVIHLTTPTAASTPVGDIAITGVTIATGAAATSYAGINATTCQATFISLVTGGWQNISITTATFS